MLTTLAVTGYRSLHSLVAPLAPLTVVHGRNGVGKSSLYRALRLLAGFADGSAVGSIAAEGGLDDVLWAGPEAAGRDGSGAQGTVRRRPISLRLGFASDELGYLADLGLRGGDPRSLFSRDPEVKREQVFSGPVARPATLLVDRRHGHVRIRDESWSDLPGGIAAHRSLLSEIGHPDAVPEVDALRRMLRAWRFYDHLRTDPGSPARRPQIGTRTTAVSGDGRDLAPALQTILEDGDSRRLTEVVDSAFPGSTIAVRSTEGLFSVELSQPGLLRPLHAAELSDGTLRFLLLCAALLSPEPPPFLVLNEPETGLHADLVRALADLIVSSSERSQILVITHSDRLAGLLEAGDSPSLRLTLTKRQGATLIEGMGRLDEPPWSWPER